MGNCEFLKPLDARGDSMKTKVYLFFILLILMNQTGCLYAVRYDGPYHGKVVDEQTREPIEGVVVLGSWWVYHFDVGGGHSTYHDAREVVTDNNGDFVVKGEGLRILSSLQPMSFVIYKSGYTYFQGSWNTLKTGIYPSKVVTWEGDMPIIPIRKLTDEERKKYSLPGRLQDAPWNKMLQMTQELNKERIYKGLEPYILAPIKAGGSK
jgi:hypothetical protein